MEYYNKSIIAIIFHHCISAKFIILNVVYILRAQESTNFWEWAGFVQGNEWTSLVIVSSAPHLLKTTVRSGERLEQNIDWMSLAQHSHYEDHNTAII